jgi:hypothetical protein
MVAVLDESRPRCFPIVGGPIIVHYGTPYIMHGARNVANLDGSRAFVGRSEGATNRRHRFGALALRH